jgi:predicted DNA-binding transcriptional regulator AlpA
VTGREPEVLEPRTEPYRWLLPDKRGRVERNKECSMPVKRRTLQLAPAAVPATGASAPVVPISSSHEPILTGEQVARLLQVKPSTIYEFTRRRANGRDPMPCLRAGKFLRFKWSAIEKWLEAGGKRAA